VVNATESPAAAGSAASERLQQDMFVTATDTLGALLRGTSSLFGSAALLGGLSTYGNSSKESASKASTDQELKRVCEELIASCSDAATVPLRSAPSDLVDAVEAFKDICKKEVHAWTSKVRLYLNDSRTVAILVAPLHGSIVREFEAYEQRRKVALNEDSKEGSPSGDTRLESAGLWSLLREWSDELQG